MTRQLRLTEEQYAALQRDAGRIALGDFPKEEKPRKYRNKPTHVDGQRFDSKREAKRHKELRLMLRAGEIQGLSRQVSFLLPGGIEYRADFQYLYKGKTIIEDAKGVKTKEYIHKKKLMAELGFEVSEV